LNIFDQLVIKFLNKKMLATQHICQNCWKEFSGRANKRFCCSDCKTSFNNTKASNLKKEMPDNKLLQKNYLILKEMYPKSKSEVPIEITKLYMKGFDFKAPSRKVKTPKNGFDYFVINGYAFRIHNSQHIIISKKDELNNL
jgi:hypothetical protein